jgi:hypothetical protein
MSERPTPTFDPYPWNQNGPGRSHRPEVMYPCDDGEWVKMEDYRDLERQLAERDEQLAEARTALKAWSKIPFGGDKEYFIYARRITLEALAQIDENAESCHGRDKT